MRTVRGRTDHVVVVGAGFAGLAAALHLAGRGREVTVVEREPWPGGRAGRRDINGYRIDTGPTVLTMPDLIDEAFAAVGETYRQRMELLPVDPAYRAMFSDGSGIDVHTDGDRMAAAVQEFAGAHEAAGYRALREWLERLYRTEFDGFIAANFDSPLSMLTPALARLASIGGFRRWDTMVKRHISDPRLRRVFTFQSLYAGRRAATCAGGLCRDRLHGHGVGGVLPARRRPGTARRAGRGRHKMPGCSSAMDPRSPRWSAPTSESRP